MLYQTQTQNQPVDVEAVSQSKVKTFIHHDFGKLERDTKPDGTRLYKTPSGKSYPSVTTVTGLHSAKGIMEWRKRVGEAEANRVSAKASSRGTRIHQHCEDFLLTWIACIRNILFLFEFVARKPYFVCIDNNNIVTAVYVWGKISLVFAS